MRKVEHINVISELPDSINWKHLRSFFNLQIWSKNSDFERENSTLQYCLHFNFALHWDHIFVFTAIIPEDWDTPTHSVLFSHNVKLLGRSLVNRASRSGLRRKWNMNSRRFSSYIIFRDWQVTNNGTQVTSTDAAQRQFLRTNCDLQVEHGVPFTEKSSLYSILCKLVENTEAP